MALKRLKIAATSRGIVHITVRNRVAMLRTNTGYVKSGTKHPRLKAKKAASQLAELMDVIDALD